MPVRERKCFICKIPLIFQDFCSLNRREKGLLKDYCREIWQNPSIEILCCSCLKDPNLTIQKRLIDLYTNELSTLIKDAISFLLEKLEFKKEHITNMYYYSDQNDIIVIDLNYDVNIIRRFVLTSNRDLILNSKI